MIDLRPEEGGDDPGDWDQDVLSEYDWHYDVRWAAQCEALTVVLMAGLRRGAAIAGIEWAGKVAPVLVHGDVATISRSRAQNGLFGRGPGDPGGRNARISFVFVMSNWHPWEPEKARRSPAAAGY